MSFVGDGTKNVSKHARIKSLRTAAEAVRADLTNKDHHIVANAHVMFGRYFLEQGKAPQAANHFRQAITHIPDNARYLSLLAKTEYMLRNEDDARRLAQTATKYLGDEDAFTFNILGFVQSRLGNYDAAAHMFARAVALEPDTVEYRDNLALIYTYFGRKTEACEQYEAILKLDPSYGKAHIGLSELQKATRETNHIPRLEHSLLNTHRKIEQVRIRFALARQYEEIGDTENAFHHLQKANADFIAKQQPDIAKDEALIDTFKLTYDTHMRGKSSDVTDTVLFVVGIPRTGTTLVDRILASHSKVESAGELQSMPMAVKSGANTTTKIVLDPQTIQRAGAGDITAIARAYIKNARLHQGARSSSIFTDKLPLNFMYAGFILTALPNARIVCLRRNPMDTVWSNYKHLFVGGARYHTYAYDLMANARFYMAYRQITDFWAHEFPDRFLILNYEDLVTDQARVSKHLLTHCGLDWDDACLDFHTSSKAIATPSANQVRQPIYPSSIGKWKAYAHHLTHIRTFFDTQGVKIEG